MSARQISTRRRALASTDRLSRRTPKGRRSGELGEPRVLAGAGRKGAGWVALAGLGLLAACTGVVPPPSEAAIRSTGTAEAAEGGLALTVYNQGTALVRDRRSFSFRRGMNEVSFADVAASIDPTSVLFPSLTDPDGTTVLEQNFEFDLVGVAALLEKYLDQTIDLVAEDGTQHRGTLLSGRGDIILKGPAGEVTVIPLARVAQFSFPELPDGLITRPTLVWRLFADRAGAQDVEVTYLTGGVHWTADYVVLLAGDDRSIDLDGWITLTNGSGAIFRDARLKLIAGDLQRLTQPGLSAADAVFEAERLAAAQPVQERAFFEYHLYEVPRPVTVRDQETKQIEFVAAGGVPSEKFSVYGGLGCSSYFWYCAFAGYPQTEPSYGVASNPKVMVMVEFDTEEVEADLPAGRVRVYQEDVDGAALLIGEDQLDHTPRGENVRLYVGDAFDIVGERVQTDFRRPSDRSLEEAFEITLGNHKDEDVTVRVVEHLFRWSEWKILESTGEYEKLDSSTIEFRVRLPANGERTLRYTVRYMWP